jgi:hypothetical protein
LFVNKIKNGKISRKTVNDNDNFYSEEIGITSEQYEMISEFLELHQYLSKALKILKSFHIVQMLYLFLHYRNYHYH